MVMTASFSITISIIFSFSLSLFYLSYLSVYLFICPSIYLAVSIIFSFQNCLLQSSASSLSHALPFSLSTCASCIIDEIDSPVDRSARSSRASSTAFTRSHVRRTFLVLESPVKLNRRPVVRQWQEHTHPVPRKWGNPHAAQAHRGMAPRPTIPSMSHATYRIRRTLVHDHVHDHIHTSLPRVATYA